MKNKKKTKIGEIVGNRVMWERKPQVQIVPNKKAYSRKQKHKTDY